MLGFLGGIIGNFLGGLLKSVLEFFVVKKLGQDEQVIATEKQANAKVLEAFTARNNVKPLTVDELPAHNATNDPDFRD